MKYEKVICGMIDKNITPSYCAKKLHMELKDFVEILEKGEFTADQVLILQSILKFNNPAAVFLIE